MSTAAEIKAAYRAQAQTQRTDELEINDDARVTLTEDGAWVAARIWVYRFDIDLCRTETCKTLVTDGGDGWDGYCEKCADRIEPQERNG